MSRARRAAIKIEYEHVDISEDIEGMISSYSYTDVASGESDAVSITIEDREKKKLLLDLNQELLFALKKQYPSKVFA